ncbi:helix-turn-helix domain-containing protein [Alteribacillus bidgolensis]|uniref:helix-turn-helix domain-containing protein n=1 Tax=Alteribacillus bidgolensis TaxID=930129 RepID=UPI000B844198
MSPSEYLMCIQIREARQLLMETGLSVKRISQRLVFSSAGYFSRTFRSSWRYLPINSERIKKYIV